MNAVRNWWLGLEQREQWLLLVLTVLLSAFVLLRFWEPLAIQRELLERQNLEARQTLLWIQSTVAQLRLDLRAQQRGAKYRPMPPDLVGTIQQTATAQQLSIKRLQPIAEGRIQIRMEKSDANNVISWLHLLEQRHQITIESMELSSTPQPGQIHLSIELRQ